MTNPEPDMFWLVEDAVDRRHALQVAASYTYSGGGTFDQGAVIRFATEAYRWLRGRDSLRAVSLEIKPGNARKEGSQVATVFNLADTDQVDFTLTGLDAKGAAVPLADGSTAAWSLADPDASGATLTVSADTLTATVAAGLPDTNLMLSVTVTNPADGTTLEGAESIIVQATAAATVGIVGGTPAPAA